MSHIENFWNEIFRMHVIFVEVRSCWILGSILGTNSLLGKLLFWAKNETRFLVDLYSWHFCKGKRCRHFSEYWHFFYSCTFCTFVIFIFILNTLNVTDPGYFSSFHIMETFFAIFLCYYKYFIFLIKVCVKMHIF